MPFTLAHPAAVVPLHLTFRRKLILSALIVGSISPDFEYLFRFAAISQFSHTFFGLFYFCLPAGFLALWLFHALIKQPMLSLLPGAARLRLEPHALHFSYSPFSRLLAILASLLIGAMTHIVWDSFTHEYGWPVKELSLLQTTIFSFAGHELKVYKVLQHTSSLLGLSLLPFWVWKWFANELGSALQVKNHLPDLVKNKALVILLLATFIIGLSVGWRSASQNTGLRAVQVFVVQTAVGGMAAFAGGVLVWSILLRAIKPQVGKTNNLVNDDDS